MNKEEIKFILQEGEGLKIEFKENYEAKSFAREIVAFANTEGGRIFIGVDDNGKIKGIEITNRLKSQLQDAARNCDPSIKINIEEFENLLVINISEGTNKPYKCSEGFFVRIGPNSQKMRRDEIVEMIFNINNKKFDETFSDIKEYDRNILESYLKKAGISFKGDNEIYNLGVSDEKGNLNNAGILFFTKNPKKYLTNAYITCVRYKGVEKVNVIDRKDFEGDLISQVENSIDFIKRNTSLAYEIKETARKEIPEYPAEAIREAILNAVMHRNYSEKGANVQIDIFDDRLSITNIGGLIKPLTKEKLGTLAVRRNPLIADLFYRINFVEKIGSGIKRIFEECKEHGNVRFEIETNGYFIATFRLIKKLDLNMAVEKTVEKTVEKIIKLIKENPQITQEELSKKVGLSRRGVEWNLAELKQKGILKRVGADKGGYWEIR